MDIKRLLLLLLAFAASGCSTAGPASFGIANLDGDGGLRLVMPQGLSPADTVQIQFPDDRAGSQCCKQLPARDFKRVADAAGVYNKVSPGTTYVYQASVPAGWADMPFIGIAVVGELGALKSGRDRVEGALPGGAHVGAQLCTSHEGVHLTGKQGDSLVTHLYLSLGYDIESPTCTPAQLSGKR